MSSCNCHFTDPCKCSVQKDLKTVNCYCTCHYNYKHIEALEYPDPQVEEEFDLEDPRDISISRSQLEKMVAGAIKSSIDAHGNVTIENRSSAAKRIVANIYSFFNERRKGRQFNNPMELRKRNRLIYLASPYNHDDKMIMATRYWNAVKATTSMMHNGLIVYSPIIHNHVLASHKDLGRAWEYWKRYDTAMLKKCDALVALQIDGYKTSVGMQAEIQTAISMDLPIFHMIPHLEIGMKHFYDIRKELYNGTDSTIHSWRMEAV